jgi:Tfp pilus assembly protein PilN
MMLEINLLPGSNTMSRGGGSPAGFLGFTGVSVRDPWIVGTAAAVVVAVTTVGLLLSAQHARAGAVAEKLGRAVRDSTRYSKVHDVGRRLTAERDSVQRQLQIIRTIDENRYNWAHILDEISRALPVYTWLTTLEQTSTVPLPPGADTLAGGTTAMPQAAAARAKQAAVVQDIIEVHPPLTIRIVGQTVDIQALTRFMRQMESSPFLQHVALGKSEIVLVEGTDVTQFELLAEYEVPPPGVVRTLPLVVPVR